ncbi:hypothetical protein LZ32DRAFT_31951 [Colletotrichum eremochloae]|nr:hypothetical protein LZ32DRAFT_31951 [Colletotrichum eremochloae]
MRIAACGLVRATKAQRTFETPMWNAIRAYAGISEACLSVTNEVCTVGIVSSCLSRFVLSFQWTLSTCCLVSSVSASAFAKHHRKDWVKVKGLGRLRSSLNDACRYGDGGPIHDITQDRHPKVVWDPWIVTTPVPVERDMNHGWLWRRRLVDCKRKI